MDEMYQRSFTNPITTDNGKRTLTGYAAVWDSPALVTDLVQGRRKTFTEVMRRGAFRTAVESKGDVIATFNHDPSKFLGRVGNNTLRLQEDNHGLRFEVDLPATPTGDEIRSLVERGDIRGASVYFGIRRNGERWDGTTRELTDLYLGELGPVIMPAYQATSVNLRSNDLFRQRLEILNRRIYTPVLQTHTVSNGGK